LKSASDEYLDASGVWPISIVKIVDGYSYAVGRKHAVLPCVVNVHWAKDRHSAVKVARVARRMGRRQPDKATAERSLQLAASTCGVKLTPDLVVQSRARMQAARLQEHMDAMFKTGQLAEFNRLYQLRRLAATARGDGFMSYSVAKKRLRCALIKRLTCVQISETRSFFGEVLGDDLRTLNKCG
jgi:hypothetical protein